MMEFILLVNVIFLMLCLPASQGKELYMGCFSAEEGNSLTGFVFRTSSLKPSVCIEECKRRGFLYAALQGGNTCYCGSGQAILSERADPSKCNMTCRLEGWKCGGKLHASVYGVKECEKAEPNKYVSYVGCYREMPQEVLKRFYTSTFNDSALDHQCMKECQKLGFLFAAIHCGPGYNVPCHCHNYYRGESERLPNSVCDTSCPNDLANKVYSVGKCYPTAYSSWFEQYEESTQFMGCYKGSTLSPQLTGYKVTRRSMGVKFCTRMCHDLGFMYAAVHAGKMCSCGNEHSPDNLKANEEECKSHSSLEFFKGGGYKRYNLYYVNNVCAPGDFIMQPPIGTRLGCFLDYWGDGRRMKHEFNDNSLTLTRCYDHCKANGYLYYATQGREGNWCYCGNGALMFEDRLDNKYCSVPCMGNKNELCGNALISNVYAIGVCQNRNFTPPLTFEKYRDKPYKPRFEGKKPWIDKFNNFSPDYE